MKVKFNLEIEENILAEIKIYASKKHITLSKLIENYFINLTQVNNTSNIIEIIEKLKVPMINKNDNLKELFYKEHS